MKRHAGEQQKIKNGLLLMLTPRDQKYTYESAGRYMYHGTSQDMKAVHVVISMHCDNPCHSVFDVSFHCTEFIPRLKEHPLISNQLLALIESSRSTFKIKRFQISLMCTHAIL